MFEERAKLAERYFQFVAGMGMEDGVFDHLDLALSLIEELYAESGEKVLSVVENLPELLHPIEAKFVAWALMRKHFNPREDKEIIRELVANSHHMDDAH